MNIGEFLSEKAYEKDSQWGRDYATNIVSGAPLLFFYQHDTNPSSLYELYPDLGKVAADRIASSGNIAYAIFLKHQKHVLDILLRDFPEQVKAAAKLVSEEKSYPFDTDAFSYFPELFAGRVAEISPSRFFSTTKFINLYPQFVKEKLEEFAKYSIDQFMEYAPFMMAHFPKFSLDIQNVALKYITDYPDAIAHYANRLTSVVPEKVMMHIVKKKVNPSSFFRGTLTRFFPEINEYMAHKLLAEDPNRFFAWNFDKKYEVNDKDVAHMARQHPEVFFANGLDEKYRKLAKKIALPALIGKDPLIFFSLDLVSKYRNRSIIDKAIQKITQNDPGNFFRRNLHKKFPKIGKMIASNVLPTEFFNKRLYQDYPDIGKAKIEDYVSIPSNGLNYFLREMFDIYPLQVNNAAKSLLEGFPAQRFFDIPTTALERIDKNIISEAASKLIYENIYYFFTHAIYKSVDIEPEKFKEALEHFYSEHPTQFFMFNLQNDFKDLVRPYAEKLLEKDDIQSFVGLYGLLDIYPDLRDEIVKKQLKFDEDNPDTEARPAYGRKYAEEIYNSGSGLFVHVGSKDNLEKVDRVAGEICVTSWDKAKTLFHTGDAQMAAVFRGKPSHLFTRDIFSSRGINKYNLRGLSITDVTPDLSEEAIMQESKKYKYDEGWINPSAPGVELVGYMVIGNPESNTYKYHLNSARELTNKKGLSGIYLTGNPEKFNEWVTKQETKPLEDTEELPYDEFVKKYKGYPGMQEYAYVIRQLVKVAEELDQKGLHDEADQVDKVLYDNFTEKQEDVDKQQIPYASGNLQDDLNSALKDNANGNQIINVLYNGDNLLRELYDGDARVAEGYTVKEHTNRVFDQYNDQIDKFDLDNVQVPTQIDIRNLMKVIVALHDIGKSIPTYAEKHRQHEFTVPIMKKTMQDLGFGDYDINLAIAIVNNDILGDLVKGNIEPQEAIEKLSKVADGIGMSLPNFFKLQSAFYTIDATSYDYVKQFFSRAPDGKFVPKSNNYRIVSDIINKKQR